MPSRRRFLQQSSAIAALAALSPLIPNFAFAAPQLLTRT
ncbi:twin-arginine translocation signal domain-containing protein, partial [Pseudomonas sp. UBA4194]